MALLEGKLNKNIFDSEELAKRVRHSSVDRANRQSAGIGEISREEVYRIVRENVPAAAGPPTGAEVSRDDVQRIVREHIQQNEDNNLERSIKNEYLLEIMKI